MSQQTKQLLTSKNYLVRELAKIILEKNLTYSIKSYDEYFIYIDTKITRFSLIFIGNLKWVVQFAKPGGFESAKLASSGKEVIKAIEKFEIIEKIARVIRVDSSRIDNIYSYGSQVYQTAKEDSDYDYLVICDAKDDDLEIQSGLINLHLFTKDTFQKMLDNHQINALESFFLPENLVIQKKKEFEFNLNLPKLRKEISAKSSNSWVKCKKKLTVEEDSYYIGIKSLFHSLRILKFGIQIAQHGRIIDYTEANDLWKEIESDGIQNWEYFKQKYQKLYNSLATEFRKLAPKEV